MGNKGQSLNLMITAGLSFVVLILLLTIGTVLEVGFSNMTMNSTAAAAVLTNGITALGTFSTWLPILALAIVGTIIIMFLIRAFSGLGGHGGE